MLSQQNRPMQLKTSLGENELVPHQLSGQEVVSGPFEFRVRMLSENPALDLKALLRTSASIALTLPDGSSRFINGLWRELKQVGIGKDRLAAYEGILSPSIWFLRLASDCRIFQHLSVPDIVAQVFEQSHLTAYRNSLVGTYAEREYCVQYRESNFAFVSRLLEEEGIFYFFEHSEGEHTLILADDPGKIQECPGQPAVDFSPHSTALGQEIEVLEPQVSVGNRKSDSDRLRLSESQDIVARASWRKRRGV